MLSLKSRLQHAVDLQCDDHPRDLVSGAIRRLICCQNVKATTKEERHNGEMKHGH